MRTDTIAISHVLFFAIASATACDLGKDDDGGSGFDDDDGSAGDGYAESSGGSVYDTGADTAPITTFPPDSATSTSAGDSGCNDSVATTGFDTEGWGSSWGSGPDEDGGSATSGSDSGPGTATTGVETTGNDTEGLSCDVPFAPGNFEYGCLCEDAGCDIYYQGVAQIPDFDAYCNCLCEAKGCGEAVGGVAEGGGEEDGGPP